MELIYFITFTRVTASNKPRTFRNIHLVADVEHRRIRSERWFERCCKKRFYSSVKALHSRQNIGPPKMFVSWSLNLWIYHRPWQGVIKVEAGIKIANYLTFIWRNYPGVSGWAQCNHKGLWKWKLEAEESVRVMQHGKNWICPWWLWRWRGGPWAKK